MTRFTIFMLKVHLNTNQPTNQPTNLRLLVSGSNGISALEIPHQQSLKLFLLVKLIRTRPYLK